MHTKNKFFAQSSDDEKFIILSFLQSDKIPMHFYFKENAGEYFATHYSEEYDYSQNGWSLLVGQNKKLHLTAAVLSVDKKEQQIEVQKYEYWSGDSERHDDSRYLKKEHKFTIPVNIIESVQVLYETKIGK